MIEVRGLSKKYGEKILFSDLSFSVRPGEHLWVSAPSGKGKTTLLRILCGLTAPDTGTVTGLKPEDVAVLFQEPRLFPQLTARENVLCVLPDPEAGAERAKELFRRLELTGAEDLLPSELSGGMAQRVALARALIVDRPVILLDEPFTGLDAERKVRIRSDLKNELRGKTLFLVSHDPEDAAALTDRVLEL